MYVTAIDELGHVFYTSHLHSFYSEAFASEMRRRIAFESTGGAYKPSRNTILAEPTPREDAPMVRPFAKDRKPWRTVELDASKTSETKPPPEQKGFILRHAQNAVSSAMGNIATQHKSHANSFSLNSSTKIEQDLELERLHYKRKEVLSKIREIDRLIEYNESNRHS